jgi:hypothetical protein
MKCPSCGFENEEGSKFCQSCGANMQEAAGAGGPAPTPPPSAPPPRPPRRGYEIDLGGWLSKGFNETFSDIGSYILLGLVVGIVGGITLGILLGPLLGGALVVVRRKMRGQGAIDIGSVFSIGFEKFVPTFVLVFVPLIILGIIGMVLPFIGALIDLVIMGVIFPWWAIGLHYIMEENAEFMDAGKKAWEILSTNLPMFWVFGIVAGIVSGIGAVVCGIGIIVTIPIGLIAMAAMLEDFFPHK